MRIPLSFVFVIVLAGCGGGGGTPQAPAAVEPAVAAEVLASGVFEPQPWSIDRVGRAVQPQPIDAP